MSNPEDVARRLGLEKGEDGYDISRKSLIAGIGGPLGIAKAILPATLFSIIFGITKEPIAAVAVAATRTMATGIETATGAAAMTKAMSTTMVTMPLVTTMRRMSSPDIACSRRELTTPRGMCVSWGMVRCRVQNYELRIAAQQRCDLPFRRGRCTPTTIS